MSDDKSMKNKDNFYLKTIVKGLLALLLIVIFIFLLAGRLDYWQGWVFSGITVLMVIVESIIFRSKSDLINERIKPGPGTKWWDKVFYVFYIPAFFAVFTIACLDAGRFGWTEIPLIIYIIGCLFYILSLLLKSWAMWKNEFFSSTVRIQSDRGQVVVQDGPYSLVRHPGYVSGILMALSSSLALGSLWGLVPAAIVAVLLIIRTYLEDTTLQRELDGYPDYTKRVRFRLIPGVW